MTTNKLLKLPSQRQLVDRLLHLIEFNHPFVFLSGKPGSGRGTLCESLLAQLPDAVRVASLIGSPEFAAAAMVPVALLMAAMFFTSIYFTVRDCFVTPEEETP